MIRSVKYISLSLIALLGAVAVCAAPTGALPYAFTINDAGDQVYFSQGNLVYAEGVFSFAEDETDYGSYFGWATSGYHDETDALNSYYAPDCHTIAYNSSEVDNPTGYGPSAYFVTASSTYAYPDIRYNSYDKYRYANYDWGVYNSIANGGGAAGIWRTLTQAEWIYLYTHHTPQWVTRGTVNGLQLTADDGVHTVFLPAAGYYGYSSHAATGSLAEYQEVNLHANYWSSTASGAANAYCLDAHDGSPIISNYFRFNAFSVRLVSDAGGITISDQVNNTATLTAHKDQDPVNVNLVRSLWSDGWNTLCLPFDMTAAEVTAYFGEDCLLNAFSSATFENGELILNMTPASSITAGTAYIIQPSADVINPTIYSRLITMVAGSGETTIEGSSISFNGIINPYQLPAGEKRYLFVTGTDQLQWSQEGDESSMYGMRAYFDVPGLAESASSIPARMRIGGAPMPTGVDTTQRVDTVTKVFRDGQLYIMHGHRCFTIQGQELIIH